MTPEEQIKQIIHDNKLVDAAEIYSLQTAAEKSKDPHQIICPCRLCPDDHYINVKGDHHEFEILTKILSWLK